MLIRRLNNSMKQLVRESVSNLPIFRLVQVLSSTWFTVLLLAVLCGLYLITVGTVHAVSFDPCPMDQVTAITYLVIMVISAFVALALPDIQRSIQFFSFFFILFFIIGIPAQSITIGVIAAGLMPILV